MHTPSSRILVVGAGFAGAVAARVLADSGFYVHVIDRRPHIAGNAFDAVNEHGVRVHAYGPHLFHTNNMKVVEWLSAFTDWVPYEHRVTALLPSGTAVPLPINRRTLEILFGTSLPDKAAVEAVLRREASPITRPTNAKEYLYSRVGPQITELFFARYTQKIGNFPCPRSTSASCSAFPFGLTTKIAISQMMPSRHCRPTATQRCLIEY